jgi:biopolymer transport protein ExbD
MSFGGFNEQSNNSPISEINVTPMVDVMLVLLVIFIITAPLLTHSVKLELPNAKSQNTQIKPETIAISINNEGKIFWNNQETTLDQLSSRLKLSAQKDPQPEIQLRADKNTRYETIAKVMATVQNNGLSKMGFVTEQKEK